MIEAVLIRVPDFPVPRDGVKRFHDSGWVYAVRYLPVTFTPGVGSGAA